MKTKNKMNPKGITLKGVNILIISAIVLAIAVLVVAQTNEELEQELNNLMQELEGAGYSWLINYSVDENLDVVSVEVYEKGGDEIVAVFENVSEQDWYKVYLTNLSSSQDTFDLKVLGNIEFDYIVDPEANDWYDSSWSYRKNITIDHTKVNGTQTNFPVLINIDDTDLRTDCLGNGDDIVFANSTGDKLDYEIELFNQTYNATHARLVAWVKIPSLSGSANTIIQMYYGNAGASNQENAHGVWDDNFMMVQHMYDWNTSYIEDSTSYENNGTKKAVNEPIENANGQIDGSQTFDGGNDVVNMGDPASLDMGTSDFTISAWIKTSGGSAYMNIAGKNNYGGGVGYSFYMEGSGYHIGKLRATLRDADDADETDYVSASGTLCDNQWHYVTASYDRSGNVIFYYDGIYDAQSDITSHSASLDNSYNLLIGRLESITNPFNGTIDEVRISNVVRSAGWINTSYANQNSPGSFYSVAGEEFGDTTYPQINFTSPTPANDTTTTNTSIEINVSITEANLDEVKWNWNGTNYTIFNDSLVLMMNFDNVSALGECYDNETEILTDEGWKYFKDLTSEEKVATLNPETHETEFHKPDRYQIYEHDDFMFRVETEEGDLLVSPEHKVYTDVKENQYSWPSDLRCLINCPVLNTLIPNFSNTFNLFSLDQRQISYPLFLNDRHNATYGISLVCSDNISSAFVLESCQNLSEMIFMNTSKTLLGNSYSSSDISAFLQISDLCLSNSDSNLTGAINSKSYLESGSMTSSLTVDCFLKNENRTLASTTNFIYQPSALYLFHIPSLTFLPNLIQSSSVNLEFSNNLFKADNIICFLALSPNSCLTAFSTTSDQSISGWDSICIFNSLGNCIFNSSINKDSDDKYINLSDFSLTKISDIYKSINQGIPQGDHSGEREVYFLNSNNKPVKVLGIEKENYSGKIYDVTVDNHIILVRRDNLTVWSGNSYNNSNGTIIVDVSNSGNNGTLYVGADGSGNYTDGRYGGGFEFDGVDDYVKIDDPGSGSVLDLPGNFTLMTWIKMNTLNFSAVDTSTRLPRILMKGTAMGDAQAWGFAVDTYSGGGFCTAPNVLYLTFRISTTRYHLCGATELQEDVWYHVVVVRSGTDVDFYLDGVLDNHETVGSANDIDAYDEALYIGEDIDNSDGATNGTIDEVRIYNRSLSASEIQQLYFMNLNKYDTDKWTLYVNQSYDEPLGSAVYTYFASAKDNSGNENLTETRTLNVNAIYPQINFTSPTPANDTTTTNTSIEINVSITESNLDEVKFNWNGTNFTIFNDSLVLMMNFDNVSGIGENYNNSNGTIIVDVSNSGNNGTLYVGADGSGNYTDGRYGGGFEFDGVDDYVDAGNIMDFSVNDFTISQWINMRSIDGADQNTFISQCGVTSQFRFEIDGQAQQCNADTLRFLNFPIENECGTTALTTDTWYHVVVTVDWSNDNLFIYLNGAVDGSNTSFVTNMNSVIEPMHIGRRSDGGQEFDGLIDEVRIYNRSLSAEEIQQQYFSNLNKYDTDKWTLYVNQSKNSTDGLDDGTYTYQAFAKDESGNLNYTEERTVSIDTGDPTISNFKFIAINSSGDQIGTDETAFNFTNLEEIECMNISFEITDETGIDSDIKIYFTANGTSACSPGNNQSSMCYNFDSSSWIEFQNNTDTSTFRDIGGSAQGDSITCSYTAITNGRNYTCQIDEHYNPNVWKHYPLNFSDMKWQTGVTERIKKNTVWKIELDTANIPLDADYYKIDFRVNATVGLTPTNEIVVYLCNSTYSTGDPSDSVVPECQLVGGKLPADLTDDGTKCRDIFTSALTSSLGDIKYVLITTDSPTSKYYSMKTYGFLGSDAIRTSISTDDGDSYSTLADGYETELNINWFYDSTNSNTTQILFKIYANDILGNNANSSIQILSWEAGDLNEKPIVDIITPMINSNYSGTIQINWTTAEPNGDSYLTNITLSNSTDTVAIASNLDQQFSNYSWDSSDYDGIFNLTVLSRENSTADALQGNDTHEILIDNTYPSINITSPTNDSLSSNNTLYIEFTRSDTNLGYCWYSNDSYLVNTTLVDCGNITGITWIDGLHNVTIWVNDTSGNENHSQVFFTIDSTNPEINFTSPTPSNDSTQASTSVYVNVSVNDTSESSAWIDWNRSLVGYWSFDSYNSTGVFDNSTYSNHGTFGGGLGTQDLVGAKRGQGLEFDGVGDYVGLGASFSNIIKTSNDFSVLLWFNAKDVTTQQQIFSSSNGDDRFVLEVKDGVLRWAEYQADKESGSVSIDAWYGITMINVNGVLSLYINAVKQTGNTAAVNFYLSGGNTFIGSVATGSALYFNGSIDQVMIFNRALSPEEINASYQAGSYRLFKNFTGLSLGASYNYTAYVIDEAGNTNQTELRFVNIIGAPSSNKFTITNSSNDNVASIDDKGDMYLMGTAEQSQGALSPTSNSFIVQNNSEDTVCYFNNTGSLFLFGSISTSSDLSGMTSSNLEFRNSTNDLVAFFDNLGNLKLKGFFVERYGSP